MLGFVEPTGGASGTVDGWTCRCGAWVFDGEDCGECGWDGYVHVTVTVTASVAPADYDGWDRYGKGALLTLARIAQDWSVDVEVDEDE